MTIGRKILLACSALLLICIPVTGVVLNRMYYKTLVDSTETYTSVLVEQIAVNLGTRTREYEDGICNMVQQWELFEKSFNDETVSDYHKRGMLSSFVNTRNTTRSPVLDMYVLEADDKLYYFNYQSQNFKNGLVQVEERMRSTKKDLPEGARAIWFTVPQENDAVYLMRCIYSASTLKLEGIVTVGIDRAIFKDQFQTLENSQNGCLLIFSQENEIVFGSGEGLPDAQVLLKLGEQTAKQDKLMQIDGKNYIFKCKYTEDDKWKVMYLVSDHQLLGQAQKVKSAIATICIVAMLAAMLVATGISRGITVEIRHLIYHMQSMKDGKWEKIAPPYPRDEIGDITQTYNQMVEDLQQVIKQLTEQMMRTERAQYRALQAEFMELQSMVNPHFIYNAMESINARAKLSGQEDISMMCTRLGRLMRAVIRPRMELVPLETELQYVEAYLDIQKTMMDGRLEVFYDFDEKPEEYKIPALLLQPLVENAVVHGISHMKDEAVILVAVSREEQFGRPCLVIRISDNGIGMKQEVLEKLFQIPENDGEIHYGVQSVIKRIQICFGEPYGVYGDSKPGEGTTFTVILPAETKNDYLLLGKEEKQDEKGSVD